ncbi:SnoaL-like domain-containing protein [Variovorax sp. YR266]|uniref:nuclear transport factor 2 family protein n=1 Tax=Variovorax sp. YR266 TaxID=1884386 RepID=UPI00089CCBB4|nr:nuclear transport factor 2 family protein [Variovorax sp. YR266]SDZ70680.1 SnoaL-like domain-containing protein [Variovorax sp. YR266]
MITNTLEQRIQALEDRAALRDLIDTFAYLGDKKDIATQMTLFTEDATVDTYFGDELFASTKGRAKIHEVFTGFIANFETLYHFNGQQTPTISGDAATATYYGLVVLISDANGQKTRNTNGVIYQDEYIRRNGQWMIAKRVSRFSWRDFEAMQAQPA